MRFQTFVVFVVVMLGGSFGAGCSGNQMFCGPNGGCGQGGAGVSTGGGDGQPGGLCTPAMDNTPVVEAPSTPPAVSGGTLAVLSNGMVAIGDSDRDEVHFVDSNWAPKHALLGKGDEPGRIVEGPAGSVFVALRGARQVAMIDSNTLQVSRFDACPAPRGLLWRATLQQLLVACADGELATLDFLRPGAPSRSTHRVIDDLRDVVELNGEVLVTTFRSPRVLKLAADGTLTPWSQPASRGNGQRSWEPRVAWRTIAASGGLVMVHQLEETTPIAEAEPCVSTYGATGTTDPTLSPALSLLTPNGADNLGFTMNDALPVDVAATPDGSSIAVAMLGSRTVHVMNAAEPGVFYGLALDSQPVSVGFAGDPMHPMLLVYSREPSRLIAFDDKRAQLAEVPLSSVSMASTGHDLFHRQTLNGIACASCHPEAGDDGHVWSLPVGARRTPTLRGGLKGTEPFHWNGEEQDMTALVSDVLVARMGGAPEPLANSQALLDWMDAQPARPAPGDLDVSAVARGQAEFVALGCGSCHAGALGTDNQSANVGTGEVLQVPRLVELAYRAPYFHAGQVKTLADRFTAAGGAGHTGTSGLSAEQVDDLVAYLKSR